MNTLFSATHVQYLLDLIRQSEYTPRQHKMHFLVEMLVCVLYSPASLVDVVTNNS